LRLLSSRYLPAALPISAPVDSGFLIRRDMGEGRITKPVAVHFSRVSRTTLCTTLDLGDSVSVATVEHVVSALSGMGIDNALITLDRKSTRLNSSHVKSS